MKISTYSFYLSGLALVLPSVSSAGPLKERFEQYPSPMTSVAQKGLGFIESASGAGVLVVGTHFSSRNQYQSFVKAYDDYQEAVQDYERAGGTKVATAKGGDVAVLLEEPAASTLKGAKGARGTTAKTKTASARGAGKAQATAEAGGATATAEAKGGAAPGAGAKSGATAAAETAAAAEESVGPVRGAINRLSEALEDKARHSEILSRVYSVSPGDADPLTKAGVNLDRARLRLKAAAEKIVAQEGTSPKASFSPFREAIEKGEPIVITRDSVNEARNIGGKISKGSLLGRLGGLILLADGIYRVYIVQDMRNPGTFPLGWLPIDTAASVFSNER